VSAQQTWKHNATGGYYGREGNTDYKYYNLGWATTANGDIPLGGLTLKDSEFLFSLEKNNSTWQGEPYEDDQSIVFKFDLWANGTFSPLSSIKNHIIMPRELKIEATLGSEQNIEC